MKKIFCVAATLWFVTLTTAAASLVYAQDTGKAKKDKKEEPAKPSDNYDELFRQYLAAARASNAQPVAADSLWMAGLNGDLRARRVNDLVTVQVNTIAVASGSGHPGDLIRVVSKGSRRPLKARITGPGAVEIVR